MWRRSIQDAIMPNQNIPLSWQELKDWLKDKEEAYKSGALSLKTLEHLLGSSVVLLNRCVDGTEGLNACHVACSVVGSCSPLLVAVMSTCRQAASEVDDRGCLPFYHLIKSFPRATESLMWMVENFQHDIKIANKEGNNVLHRMAKNRHLDFDMFKLMVNISPGVLTKCNKNGWSVLHYICRYHGANVEAIRLSLWNFPQACMMTTSDGWLPLHFLARYYSDQIASIKMLTIFNDKAVNVANEKGWLPLHHACRHDITRDVLVELLTPESSEVKTPGGFTAFHLLVIHNSTRKDVINHYLSYNPRVAMIAAKSGVTPLHSLIITNRGNDALIGLLVKTCPQVCRQTDSSGLIPYQYLRKNSKLSWATRQLLESVSMQCIHQDERKLHKDIVRILFSTPGQATRLRKDAAFVPSHNDPRLQGNDDKDEKQRQAEVDEEVKRSRKERKKSRKLRIQNKEVDQSSKEVTREVQEKGREEGKGEKFKSFDRKHDLLERAYGQSVRKLCSESTKRMREVEEREKKTAAMKKATWSGKSSKRISPITVVRTKIKYVEKIINKQVVCEDFVVLPPPPMFESLRSAFDVEDEGGIWTESLQDGQAEENHRSAQEREGRRRQRRYQSGDDDVVYENVHEQESHRKEATRQVRREESAAKEDDCFTPQTINFVGIQGDRKEQEPLRDEDDDNDDKYYFDDRNDEGENMLAKRMSGLKFELW
uniref:Uncharacterized protein n=1 Tax=Hanusia phi TaxID=3032 RepID=A0A6T7NZR1_9CRYP